MFRASLTSLTNLLVSCDKIRIFLLIPEAYEGNAPASGGRKYPDVEIEQINFQHRLAALMHCRAHAQAGYSLQCWGGGSAVAL